MTRLRKIVERINEEEREPWIGVDLDGTLAHYTVFKGRDANDIGEPIPKMVEKVKALIEKGKKFKVLTARGEFPETIPGIQDWCEKAGIGRPEVTNKKDWAMEQLWDDRVRKVVQNTGMFEDEMEEGISPAEIDLVNGSIVNQ
jgi:hypothetical protein